MAKGKSKGQKQDELERKRDERSRRKALKKEREIKEYLENDENFVVFKNQLEAIGLKIKDILGDGNCLFRALGDQLNGDHTSHAYHRRNTVQYMKNHRLDFEPFMEDGVTFEKHLAELSKLGTYGGNDSIVAFARNNGVDIVIHQLNNPRWVIHGREFSKSQQNIELHLAYHNGEHYSSVRKLADPDDGPAWKHHQKKSQVQSVENTKEKESRNKKKKERKKNQEKSGPPSSGPDTKTAEENYIDEASQLIMESTGCQDLELIQHTLQANNYDTDASLMEILQVLCVLQDQEVDGTPGYESGVIMELPDKECSKTTDRQRSGPSDDDDDDDDDDDARDQTKDTANTCDKVKEDNTNKKTENINKLPPGARPKENIHKKSHHKAPHLTNRQRKELARQEKKQNREQRRINEQQQRQQAETESVAPDNPDHTIVTDLGAVRI